MNPNENKVLKALDSLKTLSGAYWANENAFADLLKVYVRLGQSEVLKQIESLPKGGFEYFFSKPWEQLPYCKESAALLRSHRTDAGGKE